MEAFLFLPCMHTKVSDHDDYLFTLYYQGKKYNVRVKRYHSDRDALFYHLIAKNNFLDLKYDRKERKLTQLLQFGQTAAPTDFIDLLEKEFRDLHS